MNIQRKNSAHHFRMQSEREQTLGNILGHNSINLDLATNYYLCECLMTFDSSQHCIELLSHAVLSKLNTTQKSSCL